ADARRAHLAEECLDLAWPATVARMWTVSGKHVLMSRGYSDLSVAITSSSAASIRGCAFRGRYTIGGDRNDRHAQGRVGGLSGDVPRKSSRRRPNRRWAYARAVQLEAGAGPVVDRAVPRAPQYQRTSVCRAHAGCHPSGSGCRALGGWAVPLRARLS